jgi:hypothetical protein
LLEAELPEPTRAEVEWNIYHFSNMVKILVQEMTIN